MDTIDCYLAENVLKVVVSYLPLAHIAGMVYIVCIIVNYSHYLLLKQ